jgi:hypothetical protein
MHARGIAEIIVLAGPPTLLYGAFRGPLDTVMEAGSMTRTTRMTVIKINAMTVPADSGDELARRSAARGWPLQHTNYPRQVAQFLAAGPDGMFSVPSARARMVMGQPLISDACDFGWVIAWASEMGDETTVGGLLAHADRFMKPTWRDGGCTIPVTTPPSTTRATASRSSR